MLGLAALHRERQAHFVKLSIVSVYELGKQVQVMGEGESAILNSWLLAISEILD